MIAITASALLLLIAGFVVTMRKARYMARSGLMGTVRVLSAERYVPSKSSPTYQKLEILIDAQSGPVSAAHKVPGEEPPAFGIYPCWYDPENPGVGFQIQLDGLELP